MRKYLVQIIESKRFVGNFGNVVWSWELARRWDSLDQAIDFVISNELSAVFQVVDADTLRVEFRAIL